MTTTAAQDQYKAHQATVRSLLQQLEGKLARHEGKASEHPHDWGYAGDLGHVETRLQEIVAFLGG